MQAVIARACRITLAATALIGGCSKQSQSTAAATAGAPIPIDSQSLERERELRTSLDSLRRDRSDSARKFIAQFDSSALVRRITRTQIALTRLGYAAPITGAADDATTRAVRAFQQRHGLAVTGDPVSPEMNVAIDYIDQVTDNRVRLPASEFWVSSWATGAVRASGTWAPHPLARQTSTIWCYPAEHECREAYTYLNAGELRVSSVEYVIDRWDNEEISARFDALCRRQVLTIRRTPSSATLMESPRQGSSICATAPGDSIPQVRHLLSGVVVSDSLDREAAKFFLLGGLLAQRAQRAQGLR